MMVEGDAGMGKSRLVEELQHRCVRQTRSGTCCFALHPPFCSVHSFRASSLPAYCYTALLPAHLILQRAGRRL